MDSCDSWEGGLDLESCAYLRIQKNPGYVRAVSVRKGVSMMIVNTSKLRGILTNRPAKQVFDWGGGGGAKVGSGSMFPKKF